MAQDVRRKLDGILGGFCWPSPRIGQALPPMFSLSFMYLVYGLAIHFVSIVVLEYDVNLHLDLPYPHQMVRSDRLSGLTGIHADFVYITHEVFND